MYIHVPCIFIISAYFNNERDFKEDVLLFEEVLALITTAMISAEEISSA